MRGSGHCDVPERPASPRQPHGGPSACVIGAAVLPLKEHFFPHASPEQERLALPGDVRVGPRKLEGRSGWRSQETFVSVPENRRVARVGLVTTLNGS